MRKIFSLFARDLRSVRTNVVALVVAVGLVIVPSLYAWFNIAAEWDPYANTGGVRVAVANADAGFDSELLPQTLNLGEQVVSALRANDQLDWVFVDTADDAIEGVRSGAYYAALVIPEDFSTNMLGVLSPDPTHATIDYYSNEKESAIAPEVTDQGADTVRVTVNQIFTQTVGEVGSSVMGDLASFLNSDQVTNLASRLDATVVSSADNLRAAAGHVQALASLVDSATTLVDGTTDLLGSSDDASSGIAAALSDSKSGVSELEGALSGTTQAVSDALSSGAASFDSVDAAVDQAFDTGTVAAGDASGILRTQAEKVQGSADDLSALSRGIANARDTLNGIVAGSGDGLDSLIARVDGAAATQQALANELTSAADNLDGAVSGAATDRQAIKDLIAQSKASLGDVRSEYEETLRSQARELAGSIDGVAASVTDATSALDNTVATLEGASATTSEGLAQIRSALDTAASDLTGLADQLDEVHARVAAAVSSGDVEAIRQALGDDPAELGASLSQPVGLERTAVWPIENTGSSMAPYFTTLAIWVGCVILSAMMSVAVPERVTGELGGLRPHEAYLGRFLVFWLLSFLQATLVAMGDLFFLGIQCVHPWLFLAAAWLASFVFLNIVYALVASFGDVGKAIGVVFMVAQVAGAGGIFPVEVMPDVFKGLYDFLPFVHSMGMMKFAVAGGLPGEFAASAGALAAFLVPALLLGLVARRPVMRANAWFMRQLESTKVM